MANSFTVLSQLRFGGPSGKSFILTEGNLIIDTPASGGAVPDDLPASLFKLKKIKAVLGIVPDGEDRVIPGVPDFTGDSLLAGGGAANATLDLTADTYKVTLIGTA